MVVTIPSQAQSAVRRAYQIIRVATVVGAIAAMAGAAWIADMALEVPGSTEETYWHVFAVVAAVVCLLGVLLPYLCGRAIGQMEGQGKLKFWVCGLGAALMLPMGPVVLAAALAARKAWQQALQGPSATA